MTLLRSSSVRRAFAAVLAATLVTGCSGSDDDPFPSFTVRTAGPVPVVSGSTPFVVSGRHAVYFASEAQTGTAGVDLNGDGDTGDVVAIYVDLQQGTSRNLAIAARAAAILQGRIFLVVEESDSTLAEHDFDGGGHTSRVLVTMAPADALPVLVDTLPGGPPADLVVAGGRVWYRGSDAVAVGETTLRFVTQADPTTPQIVSAADAETHVNVRPVHSEANVLFCFIDEVADGIDHNGSGGATQTTVVALVDAAASAPRVRNTGLAVADANTPMVARTVPGGDRVVAFLVSEAAQGTSLNVNPPGLPSQCAALADNDNDTADDVLHWLRFAEWDTNPATSPPVNTGLPGTSRVVLIDGHVATLVEETAQGGGCDYNASGTTTDTVVRWVALQTGAAPVTSPARNLAVDTSTPGGAFGLAALGNRFIAALDVESNEDQLPAVVNPSLADKRLIGWAAPNSASWNVAVRTDTATGFAMVPVTVRWMAPTAQLGRLAIGFDESVGLTPVAPFNPVSLNSECGPLEQAKDSDTTDTIVAWLRFTGPQTLQLFGVGFAVFPSAPGIVLAANQVFFRVSELHHNVDLNGDGDGSDTALVRRPLGTCNPAPLSAWLNKEVQPAIHTDGVFGALMLVDEDETFGPAKPGGVDVNQDGKVGGFVVRFFRF